MKKTTIQISFDTEKLDALRQYMTGKETEINTEMEDALAKIYRRVVPREVQNFLEMREARDAKKLARPVRQNTPRTASGGMNNGQEGAAQ